MNATVRSGRLAEDLVPQASADWRGSLRQGYVVIALFLGGFALWAMIARLDGAAVADGVVAVESNRKTIQHLEGGIVQEILVRNGDAVEAGEELLRLDPTRANATTTLYQNQLAILLAQEARLLAETELKRALVMPQEVASRALEPSVAPVVADQNRLFETRLEELDRNLQVADSELAQAEKDIEQNRVELATARATLTNIGQELDALLPLYERQLVATTRIKPLQREKLRLEGVIEGGELQAKKLATKLEEVRLKRAQAEQDYRKDASSQLIDIRKTISDVRQNIVISEDGRKRGVIRAPIAGTVQELKVFTIGGVIRPGEPILDIVPAKDELVVRAKIRPDDIDRVTPGMTAELKFPAFHYWGGDVITGTLRSLSRDRIVDDQGRDVYFAAEVLVDKGTLPAQIDGKLMAGMTADVLIKTEPRTVANYLLRPLVARFEKSMRER
jgi:HlyD family type I secretion membrane fusion protein